MGLAPYPFVLHTFGVAPYVKTDRLRTAALDALNAITEALLSFHKFGTEPNAITVAMGRLRKAHSRLSSALNEAPSVTE
jgi:hypothetical protein